MRVDAKLWLVREEHCWLYIHYCESSKSQFIYTTMTFQEGPHQILFFHQESEDERRARRDKNIYDHARFLMGIIFLVRCQTYVFDRYTHVHVDTYVRVWHIRTCLTYTYVFDTYVHVWHICTCLTHTYMFDIYIHIHVFDIYVRLWHIRTCLTYTYVFDIYVHVWHIRTCLTYTYMFDTYVHVWHIRTCLAHTYMFDIYVHVWHICTCVHVWNIRTCLVL